MDDDGLATSLFCKRLGLAWSGTGRYSGSWGLGRDGWNGIWWCRPCILFPCSFSYGYFSSLSALLFSLVIFDLGIWDLSFTQPPTPPVETVFAHFFLPLIRYPTMTHAWLSGWGFTLRVVGLFFPYTGQLTPLAGIFRFLLPFTKVIISIEENKKVQMCGRQPMCLGFLKWMNHISRCDGY